MVTQTVVATRMSCAALDAMAEAGHALAEELCMVRPIDCELVDGEGHEILRFVMRSEAEDELVAHGPVEWECEPIQLGLGMQGASLRMRDANGVVAEILLVIAAGGAQ